jgi:hypothetical protein
VKKACRANDPNAARRALHIWVRRLGASSLEALSKDEPALADEIGRLDRRLYAGVGASSARSGGALLAVAEAARASRRASERARGRRPALPSLNRL